MVITRAVTLVTGTVTLAICFTCIKMVAKCLKSMLLEQVTVRDIAVAMCGQLPSTSWLRQFFHSRETPGQGTV